MDDEKKTKLSLRGADPKLPFYITGDLWMDGSVDISTEGKDAYALDEALETAKGIVDEHGGTMFVIECRVIRKVSRRSVRVETVKTERDRTVKAKS